jgi:hypothetical protein
VWPNSTYHRPELPSGVYIDDTGHQFEYGHRYNGGGLPMAPEEAYSVVSHPNRFAPLWQVADDLVAALERDFDVSVGDVPSVTLRVIANDVIREEWVARAVCLTPNCEDSSPLVIIWQAPPAEAQDLYVNHVVRLLAGAMWKAIYPDCGCDACDDDLPSVATVMERDVTAIVTGNLTEHIDHPLTELQLAAVAQFEAAGSYGIENEDGSAEWSSSERIQVWAPTQARKLMPNQKKTWKPWPLRT